MEETQVYIMPVKAIKRIMGEELKAHFDGFQEAYPKFIMTDTQKEIVQTGYSILEQTLKACLTYDELDHYLSVAGYRMSLQEWIDSL